MSQSTEIAILLHFYDCNLYEIIMLFLFANNEKREWSCIDDMKPLSMVVIVIVIVAMFFMEKHTLSLFNK